MAVSRVKETKISDSGTLVKDRSGMFDLIAFKVILGVIWCTCLNIAIKMKTAGHGAKLLLRDTSTT